MALLGVSCYLIDFHRIFPRLKDYQIVLSRSWKCRSSGGSYRALNGNDRREGGGGDDDEDMEELMSFNDEDEEGMIFFYN